MEVIVRSFGFLLLAFLIGSDWLVAQVPTPDKIAEAIRQLGSDNFATREKATRFLWSAGRAAEADVQKAIVHENQEIARRALILHEKFRWGIYPDTPKEHLQLIDDFRQKKDLDKAVLALVTSDPKGGRLAIRLIGLQ